MKHGFDLLSDGKPKPTLLDIGCGYNSLVSKNNLVFKTGFDGWKPSLELAEKNKTHDELVHGTFLELDNLLGKREFDFIIAIDFIEHLEKEEGFYLLNWMEKHAKCGVVLYTPNGFLPQPHIEEGDFQKHLSGWDVDDFTAAGYSCTGAAGLKFLRKEFHEIAFKPRPFWAALSHMSQIMLTSYFSRLAAGLWATKIISHSS